MSPTNAHAARAGGRTCRSCSPPSPLAQAQDKTIELKLSHWVPASHPLHKALRGMGRSRSRRPRAERSSTRSIRREQLGKAFDHYDMARDGIADMTYINPGYQPGRFPIIGAGELPFLMANAKGGSSALDAWYRKYAATEMKDVKFCLAFVHDPGTFHSRTKKIMVPGRHQGHEDPAGARHDRDLDDAARRHQRAGARRRRCATSSRRASPTR